jgi:hypothetical protein
LSHIFSQFSSNYFGDSLEDYLPSLALNNSHPNLTLQSI